MKRILSTTLLAAGMVAASAGTASAQGFNFWTEGQFTSPVAQCTTARATTVTCNDPGSTLALTFTGTDFRTTVPFGFASGATVQLGTFNTAGNGSATTTGAVQFRLYINQTMPTTGSNSTVGYINGSISRVPGSPFDSDLIWMPNEIVVIDQVTYDLIFRENNLGIVLAAAQNTTIEAVGTVVPEPSTYALMATGLAGLFVLRRKRRSA